MDKKFADVAEQYEAWASAQLHPTRAIDNGDAHGFAQRVMGEALAGKAGGREEIAAFEHDYARLLARTSQERRERRERASWRDAPLAVLANVWDALTRRWWALPTATREDVTLALFALLGGLVAALIVGRG